MYGFENVARTTFVPFFCSPSMSDAMPSGAASLAVEELAPKYDDTIATSAPCAARNAFSIEAGKSAGCGLATYVPPATAAPAPAPDAAPYSDSGDSVSARVAGKARDSSALN